MSALAFTLFFTLEGSIVWDGFWDGEAAVGGAGLLRLDFAPRAAFRYLQK
jgi:hypothetical protein